MLGRRGESLGAVLAAPRSMSSVTIFELSFRKSALIAGALLTLGVAAGGCSSDNGEESSEVTRYDFCERWAEAACSSEVVSVCQASDVDDCKAAQSSECLDKLPDEFFDRGVDDCIGAVEAAYEDADLSASELSLVLRYGGACSDVVLGKEVGGKCALDADCEPALSCVLKDDEEGTCQEASTIEPGFSCSEPEEMCEDGFFCDGSNCVAGLPEGEDCQNDSQCEAGLYCDETCSDMVEVGESCDSDAECLSGICYPDSGDQTCLDRMRLSPAEPLCDSLK